MPVQNQPQKKWEKGKEMVKVGLSQSVAAIGGILLPPPRSLRRCRCYHCAAASAAAVAAAAAAVAPGTLLPLKADQERCCPGCRRRPAALVSSTQLLLLLWRRRPCQWHPPGRPASRGCDRLVLSGLILNRTLLSLQQPHSSRREKSRRLKLIPNPTDLLGNLIWG